MSKKRDYNLTEMAAIRELVKIGLGQATSSLSALIGRPLSIDIPKVETIALESVPDIVGNPEVVSVGILMPVTGDIAGHVAFIMPWESACVVWKSMSGTSPIGPRFVDELSLSVMLETGSIINGSFLNAIGDLTTLHLVAAAPRISVDLTYAISTSIVAEAELSEAVALAIETTIYDIGDDPVSGYFLCIPDAIGLDLLLSKFGVKEAA